MPKEKDSTELPKEAFAKAALRRGWLLFRVVKDQSCWVVHPDSEAEFDQTPGSGFCLRISRALHGRLLRRGWRDEPESPEVGWIVVKPWIVGNQSSFETTYETDLEEYPDREVAISHGFEVIGCDDFLVVEIVGGELTRLCWMREVKDDPEELAAIGRHLDIPVKATPPPEAGAAPPPP